ncbi:MAG: hypothetical protein V1845_00585 [bacterium]
MSKKLFIFLIIIAALLAGYWYFYRTPAAEAPETSESPKTGLNQTEARQIAEATCIKGGESLAASGLYNENSKSWWFDANLNATQQGCNPACVVSEDTKTAEVNWRCTGLGEPNVPAGETLRQLFAQKYPKYGETLSVIIEKETESHARGLITFVDGEPGGIFLAAKVNSQWQIVHDGNGQIPCSLSSYGFPSDMLADCAN